MCAAYVFVSLRRRTARAGCLGLAAPSLCLDALAALRFCSVLRNVLDVVNVLVVLVAVNSRYMYILGWAMFWAGVVDNSMLRMFTNLS